MVKARAPGISTLRGGAHTHAHVLRALQWLAGKPPPPNDAHVLLCRFEPLDALDEQTWPPTNGRDACEVKGRMTIQAARTECYPKGGA